MEVKKSDYNFLENILKENNFQIQSINWFKEDNNLIFQISLLNADLNECVRANQILDKYTDFWDNLTKEDYYLEVCSAGPQEIQIKHINNFINQKIKVILKIKEIAENEIIGKLKLVEPDRLTIEINKKGLLQKKIINFNAIEKIMQEYEIKKEN